MNGPFLFAQNSQENTAAILVLVVIAVFAFLLLLLPALIALKRGHQNAAAICHRIVRL